MSNTPTTPRAKATFNPATPATTRVAATNAPNTVHASPHYATTRRHSLYGVEDRVVIDPGSRIWKVGFSGEGRPRDVFYGGGPSGPPFWKLTRAMDPAERAEEDKLLEARLQGCLRSVFHDSLLADPKARKVILVEHPLLPLYIKELSLEFYLKTNHLLSLLAVGRITGLVIDCGHLESVALPTFVPTNTNDTDRRGTTNLPYSRSASNVPTYLPPPTSLSAAISVPAANRSTRVPQEVLTDAVVEEIKTRCCFVGDVLDSGRDPRRGETPAPSEDEGSEMDFPPSDISLLALKLPMVITQVPRDLRKTMASSILVSAVHLCFLDSYHAFMQKLAAANAGKAPAFSPALCLGRRFLSRLIRYHRSSLKTGGVEVAREKWDEEDPNRNPDDSMDISADSNHNLLVVYCQIGREMLYRWVPLLPTSTHLFRLHDVVFATQIWFFIFSLPIFHWLSVLESWRSTWVKLRNFSKRENDWRKFDDVLTKSGWLPDAQASYCQSGYLERGRMALSAGDAVDFQFRVEVKSGQ
ncbi:hypothetical protein BDZ97DRAFT_1755476 [Flammula alnicola]|nr:hypothetical protein BDZ97DRAFT_1755476 [Flammula alnicola]